MGLLGNLRNRESEISQLVPFCAGMLVALPQNFRAPVVWTQL